MESQKTQEASLKKLQAGAEQQVVEWGQWEKSDEDATGRDGRLMCDKWGNWWKCLKGQQKRKIPSRAPVELAEEESKQLRDRENTTDAKTVSVKQKGAFSTERECIQEEAEASG